MGSKKRGLGRGLGALIPPAPDLSSRTSSTPVPTSVPASMPASMPASRAAADGAPVVEPSQEPEATDTDLAPVPARYLELPINDIEPNARQPRQVFDEEALAELVHSIREIGLLQPIVVRPAGDRWELVAGERRWRASQEAGLTTIPAIVRDTPDDQMLRDALLENLHRAALNPLEEAAAYQQLLDDFECTQEQLATRIGRSRPQVSNTLRLLKLPPSVARRVAAGVLSAGHARAILSLDDEQAMEDLANRVIAEGLSVRATEEIVAVWDGGRPRKTRRPRTTAATPPELAELAERVADHLETRVTVSGRKLVIEYGSVDDLRRIVDAIAQEN